MWTGRYGLWRVVRVHAAGTDPDASREITGGGNVAAALVNAPRFPLR